MPFPGIPGNVIIHLSYSPLHPGNRVMINYVMPPESGVRDLYCLRAGERPDARARGYRL